MNIDEFDELIKNCKDKLSSDSAFEKLLKVLVDYGMDENLAAEMIADCIDEQYELDEIKNDLSNAYQEAKDKSVFDCNNKNSELLN